MASFSPPMALAGIVVVVALAAIRLALFTQHFGRTPLLVLVGYFLAGGFRRC